MTGDGAERGDVDNGGDVEEGEEVEEESAELSEERLLAADEPGTELPAAVTEIDDAPDELGVEGTDAAPMASISECTPGTERKIMAHQCRWDQIQSSQRWSLPVRL